MAKPKELHPDGREDIFQHPTKGCLHKIGTDWRCYVNDYGNGSDYDRDIRIMHGQPAHMRLALGEWLATTQPGDDKRLTHQQFINEVFPPDWTGETPEGKQLHERLDMTISVMGAGGACTICLAEPDENKAVEHLVGCEYVSFVLHSMEQVLIGDHEPTLADAVREANEQIARMA